MATESDNDDFPMEADTLTTHARGVLPDTASLDPYKDDGSTVAIHRPRRRDTMPVPPSVSGRTVTMALPQPPSIPLVDPIEEIDAIDDEDILEADPYEENTAATAKAKKVESSPSEPPPLLDDEPSRDDRTSPTLALANRSDSAREVYRRFLASEYAPALALANELLAQGDHDPMLITIARECRVSLTAESMSSAPPSSSPGSMFDGLVPRIDGKMTLDEVASMTGMSLDQVLHLLERFVSMGAITLRR